jgi:membrane protease subunit HflC
MRRMAYVSLVLIALIVAALWAGEFGFGPVVITREDQHKLILRLGDPVAILDEPGIAARIPLLDAVEVYDRRIQYMDARPVEMLIARGEKLIVDFFVLWRINDPLAFRQNFGNDMRRAEDRIQERVNALVGAKIGGLELSQLLQRSEVLSQLDEESSAALASTGVQVVDVRLNRTEIPSNAEPAAFAQMREQRRALAREYRVGGERQAREIRAEAERISRTGIAEAQAKADRTRGAGDAQAARIYADAFDHNPEFYSFVRSLEAYRNTIGEGTTMVLPPTHEFFRYLQPSLP